MCSRFERQELWANLVTQSSSTFLWLVVGDFNTILNCTEKKGGLPPDSRSMQEFSECLVSASLSDLGFEGPRFTWCNEQRGARKILQRLDRILCNGHAYMILPALKVKHLSSSLGSQFIVVALFDTIWFNRNVVAHDSSSFSIQDLVIKAKKKC